MHLSDFHIKTDAFPLISSTDELIIVHRNQVAIPTVVYVGCHRAAVVPVRSALNRDVIDAATPWTTLTLQTGTLTKIDLPGTGNPLDVVTKIQPTSGHIFVFIASPGQFDAYLRQFATNPS